MSREVLVIGCGASGMAAVHAAAKLGARVTVITGGPGATSLSSGALDDGAKPRSAGDPGAHEILGFLEALGIWHLGSTGCHVATTGGLVRSTSGHDRAVLDLQAIEPGLVGVAAVERQGWDPKSLARAWTEEPWSLARGLRFEPVAVEALRRAEEDRIPLADLAALHDDSDRVRWLGDRLRESTRLREASAVMLGPWLGLRAGVALELSRALGKPVGEPLSGPGGVAGLRFEGARDALLGRIGAQRIDDFATRITAGDAGMRIELASGSSVTADAVVMAVGGLVGGGIEWDPSLYLSGFATSLRQPAELALHGRPLVPSGSPDGALFEKFAWSGESKPAGLERVGIRTDGKGLAQDAAGNPVKDFYAAGDAVADAPRTLVEAIRSGLAAGARAARGA